MGIAFCKGAISYCYQQEGNESCSRIAQEALTLAKEKVTPILKGWLTLLRCGLLYKGLFK